MVSSKEGTVFNIPDKWLYFPVVIFGVYFLLRLVDESQLMFTFPLHYTNDSPAYMALLYFFAKYGYHGFVQEWFNGFTLFLSYPPGWFYFALPFYRVFGNVQYATYISVVLMFIITFVVVYYFGRSQGFSAVKCAAFFFVLFGNPLAIGNFLRLLRVTELFGWFFFLALSALLIYYRKRPIDYKFFITFFTVYTLSILSHPAVVLLFHLIALPFMLIVLKKDWRERLILAVGVISGIVVSSFWWIPFVRATLANPSSMFGDPAPFAFRLLDFKGPWIWDSISSFVATFFLWFSFYFYLKGAQKKQEEIIFYSPLILLSLLFVTRLIVFIPAVNNIYPDIFMFAFTFFALFFLFKGKYKGFLLRKVVMVSLVFFTIASLAISLVHTGWFVGYTQLEKDAIDLLPSVKGRFLMPKSPSPTLHPGLFYAFASVKYGTSTSFGTRTIGMISMDYMHKLEVAHIYFNEKNCEQFKLALKDIKTTEVIAFDEYCEFVESCRMELVKQQGRSCLYRLNDAN